jgi:peptide deformylase
MAPKILPILYWPNEKLREIAQPVSDPASEQEFIDSLFATMYDDKGIGLAATQVGVAKRIFVMDTFPAGGSHKKPLINPIIKEKRGTATHMEGCLSFPGIYFEVERAAEVILETLTLTGATEELTLTGIDAICAQHEIDHLNGVVFFDYLKQAKRVMMEDKLRKNIKKLRKHK